MSEAAEHAAPGAADAGASARARAAAARHDWRAVVDELSSPHVRAELDADGLFSLADAAWWLGEADLSIDAAEAAYRRYLAGEQVGPAAMAAGTVATNLLLRGEHVLGVAWLRRASRLVADRPDTVEHHYLRYLTAVDGRIDRAGRLPDGAFEELLATAFAIRTAGQRLGDPNLQVLGAMAVGRIRLKRGLSDGLALLDEAMLRVVEQDVAPDWAGNVYCHLLAACHEVGDLRRAKEWTAATERWLDTLPAAVVFRGICRVHRSQLMGALGAWDSARAEAERVCADLAVVAPGTTAEAHYLIGDLRRLQGDFSGAESSYQRALAAGRDPQPGIALLRLAEGRVGAALADVRAALVACAGDRLACVPLWSAQVTIALEAGDPATAETACRELEALARVYATAGLECDALHARGAVELAAGRAEHALPVLREVTRRLRELGAEPEAASTGLLLAAAYDALGADDAAELERTTAHRTLVRLGVPARARPAGPGGGPLTAREAEVLAEVAAGGTNHDVAAALSISEKTVARHLSSIFTKLGVRSRTEAAAWAFRHGLGT